MSSTRRRRRRCERYSRTHLMIRRFHLKSSINLQVKERKKNGKRSFSCYVSMCIEWKEEKLIIRSRRNEEQERKQYRKIGIEGSSSFLWNHLWKIKLLPSIPIYVPKRTSILTFLRRLMPTTNYSWYSNLFHSLFKLERSDLCSIPLDHQQSMMPLTTY